MASKNEHIYTEINLYLQ